jgi:hypothetical protein
LIRHIASLGGSWEIFEIPTGELAAVFTIMPLEYENLQRFGNVVFLDGTMVRNALGWTIFPITIITESCQIVSEGLLFTAFETKLIFDWILGSLAHRLSGILRTIATDENSTFVCFMI